LIDAQRPTLISNSMSQFAVENPHYEHVYGATASRLELASVAIFVAACCLLLIGYLIIQRWAVGQISRRHASRQIEFVGDLASYLPRSEGALSLPHMVNAACQLAWPGLGFELARSRRPTPHGILTTPS
jgi:hypothetical protein